MSFCCDRCHKPQPPGTKLTRQVIERRNVEYVNVVNGSRVKSKGVEIVREIGVCPRCAKSRFRVPS